MDSRVMLMEVLRGGSVLGMSGRLSQRTCDELDERCDQVESRGLSSWGSGLPFIDLERLGDEQV